jgi:hypothetical protein
MTRSTLLALAAATIVLAAPSHAQDRTVRVAPPHPPVYRPQVLSVTLEDQLGNTLPTYGGFALGSYGQRYNVRVHNLTGERLEAVVAVDGRDAISGQSGNATRDRGYLVPANGSVLIQGFRTSLDSVAVFRFTSPAQSYAGRLGQAYNVGQVSVAAFRERPEPVVVMPRDDRYYEGPPPPALKRAPQATPSARRESASPAGEAASRQRGYDYDRPQQGNLGTEFGEQSYHPVREVVFHRASPTVPDQRVTIRYDDAAGLRARGLLPPPRPLPPPLPIEPVDPYLDYDRWPAGRFAQPPP